MRLNDRAKMREKWGEKWGTDHVYCSLIVVCPLFPVISCVFIVVCPLFPVPISLKSMDFAEFSTLWFVIAHSCAKQAFASFNSQKEIFLLATLVKPSLSNKRFRLWLASFAQSNLIR